MKHLGDITKLKGSEVPLTEIVVGGSPCQDLSLAGKRAGLAGARSGLFMEQIRLIKEMRENDRKNGRTDEHIRPRYMVWENVPGAFSSNKGEDFRAVLEETAKVAEGDACIPRLEKWPHAGCIMGDGWSLAWRLHDAQFWGVPQRRKRIALVADFGGATAPEILFERKGLSRDPEESGETREGAAADAQGSTGKAISFQERAGKPGGGGKGILIQDERIGALSTLNNQSVCCLNDQGGMAVVQGFDVYNQQSTGDVAMPLRNKAADSDHIPVVCIEGNGSRPSHRGDGYSESETMYTLNSTEHHAVAVENHPADSRVKVSDDGNVPMAMNNIQTIGHDIRSAKFTDDEITDPLTATDYKDPIKISHNSVVRRLTPLECERLQGFPDGWTDIGDWIDSKGKKHKGEADSPRYKALGNSIALPFWRWMAERMVRLIKNDEPTMASLFSGIGGFELVFARAGAKPVWNSEIESYPEAVTRVHFGDDEKGIKGDYEKYL